MLQVAEQSMQADPGDAEGVSAMFQDMFEKYVEDYVENNGTMVTRARAKGRRRRRRRIGSGNACAMHADLLWYIFTTQNISIVPTTPNVISARS